MDRGWVIVMRGACIPCRCIDGVKFGTEGGTYGPLRAKLHPHRCKVRVAPAGQRQNPAKTSKSACE